MAENQVIIEVKIDVERSITQIEELKIAIKEQQAIMKLYGKDTDEFKKAAVKVYEMKEQVSVLSRETKNQVKLMQAQAGSIAAMRAQLNANQNAYDNLSEAQRDNTNVGKVLLAQIQQQDAELKILEASTGRHQRKVGQYENATKELNEALLRNTKLYESLSEAEKRNKSIGGELRNVIDAQKATIKKVSDELSGYNSEMKRTESFGTRMRDTISKIGISFKEMFGAAALAQLAVNGIITAFRAAKDGITATINSVQTVGDAFQERMTGMKEAGLAFARSLATMDFSNLISGLKESYEAGKAYAKIMDMLADKNNALRIQTAVIDKQISELRAFARLKTNDITERKAAIDKIIELEKEKLTITKSLRKEELDAELKLASDRSKLSQAAVMEIIKRLDTEEKAAEALKRLKELEQQAVDVYIDQKTGIQTLVVNKEKLNGLIRQESAEMQKNIYFAKQWDLIDDELRKNITERYEAYSAADKAYFEGIGGLARMRSSLAKELLSEEKATTKEATENSQERKKRAEKAAEDIKKKAEELEKLRVEIMPDGIEKEKASEKLRYQNYIAQWGFTEEAYTLHMRNMAAIDKKYADEKASAEAEANAQQIKAFEDYMLQQAKQKADFEALVDSNIKTYSAFAKDMTDILNGSIDENGLNLKMFGKQLMVYMLDILEKQVQASIAASTVGSLASPQSIATGGAAGALQAGILAGLITAAFNVAKGFIMREPQGLATGTTNVTKSGVFTVGERGPEQVVLPRGAAVIPNSLMDFANVGNFNVPFTAGSNDALIKALREMRVVATIEDINAKMTSEYKRIEISKV